MSLRDHFLAGMGRVACTVNLVTTDGAAGRTGLTVSAMASVSADGERPVLLVCVHGRSPGAQLILANGAFSVSVLRENQGWLSDVFAGRTGSVAAERFASGAWIQGATGSPRLVEALAAFDCETMASQHVGTHHVIFGHVAAVTLAKPGAPLVYADHRYGKLQPTIHTAGSSGSAP